MKINETAHKKISFTTNKEDVRKLSLNQITLIVQRFNAQFIEKATGVNESIIDRPADEVLENLSQLADTFTDALLELENCSSLIMQIEPIKEDQNEELDLSEDPEKKS